ncbi:MAG: O-antigen ligase family protein [Bacteroidota bacterium]
MKKTQSSKSTKTNQQVKSKLKLTYYLLLLAYILIPAYTPNFYTLDSNGPKFLAIAVLNMISFFVFLADKDFNHRTEMQSGFFRNLIGMAYSLFLIITLLSFFQAYNIPESVINFAKLFSVFASIYALYVIFLSNRDYLLHVAIAFCLLLLFDSFTVFYHISEYINKQVSSIDEIKTVYSNKNILGAALFVKIPAAIWLMFFRRGWTKYLGNIAFFTGVLATLFMSTRSFYLGLVILSVAVAFLLITAYVTKKTFLSLKKIISFTIIIITSIFIFTLVQQFLYPKVKNTYNAGVVDRLSTLKQEAEASSGRITNWERSFKLIKEHPLLGVGTGNWKIQVLKYEAPTADNYIISYKNHDDFIEVTAETGLLGGLAYIAIFILILYNFIRKALDRGADEETLKYLFLPAFGILAYSMDAAFNFPNDRPEIQALFAIYVAMGIAFSGLSFGKEENPVPKSTELPKSSQKLLPYFIKGLAFLLIGSSAVILYMNTVSLHFQRLTYEDEKRNAYSHPSAFYADGFPSIPNISCLGAPITTYIARYLINENRSAEAVSLLTNDNPSPYDARREYYLSMAYDKLKNNDSVIYWGQRVIALKPLHANIVLVVSTRLFDVGRREEAVQTLENYLALVKTNQDAWLRAIEQNMIMGNSKKALTLSDTAAKYLPDDKKLADIRRSIFNSEYIKPYKPLYDQADQAFIAKQYSKALALLNDFISKKPEYIDAYPKRAICLYYLHEYSRSLMDVEKALKNPGANKPYLLNLRGVNYIGLGNTGEACADFKVAMDGGNNDAVTNYQRFCVKK